jgi:hypothetical protein
MMFIVRGRLPAATMPVPHRGDVSWVRTGDQAVEVTKDLKARIDHIK